MTDITARPHTTFRTLSVRRMLCVLLVILSVGIGGVLMQRYAQMDISNPALEQSALAQLGVWMADQSEEDAPESVLGGLAKSWAAVRGEESLSEATAIDAARWPLWVLFSLTIPFGIFAVAELLRGTWPRRPVLGMVGVWTVALFFVPTVPDDNFYLQVVLVGLASSVVAAVLMDAPLSRAGGFILALAVLLGGVEGLKLFAQANDYAITAPVESYRYTAYETPVAALDALESGEISVILADARTLTEAAAGRASIRVNSSPGRDEYRLGLPIRPTMAARVAFAVRADDPSAPTDVEALSAASIGAITGDFAQTDTLESVRSWVLLDLKIFNDVNLPHLETITEAFLQPARRNGPVLLARILAGNALYTWTEAALGFAMGALLGFGLGAVFAHSRLLERGLLPYVIASQTVPILAIAPMVVIWLGAGPIAVSVISAYLTFFPVTINTLRGLTSPNPLQVDLMRSLAATRWHIFVKLRLPAAVPYIFTALKVSATASVVGAIIGELPSSIRDGLARAILDFSSSYNETSTPKLFAAIVVAALVGIAFFLLVSLIERVAMRRFIPHGDRS
ncbi:MAG: ABC transporter permease [Anaerolineae bacterium]|jgi:NitT/TauT family transport system permease protein|nr:ABC transporter permease [Anaerolineae bacterium]